MSYQSTTPHFDLPQFQLTDAFQMGDFNTAFSNIDSKVQAKVAVTGLLKGFDEGLILPAIPGTDYVVPYSSNDTLSLRIQTAGYITGGSNVHFYIPFSRPVYGNPTITVTSNGNWAIRSDGKYAFGGDAVTPTSITVAVSGPNGIAVYATFDNTTDAQNNAACGIDAAVQITFSYDEGGNPPPDPSDIYAEIIDAAREVIEKADAALQKLDDTLTASDARYANAITEEAAGKVANLTDAWAGGVLPKCEISGQEAGITPAKVTVCGKNLAVSSRFLGEEASPGCVYAECELEPNTTYTFSLYVPAGEKYYTNEKLCTYVTKPVSTGEVLSYTVTTLEELSKENKSQYVNRYGWQLFKNSQGYSSSGNARDLQVELGDTATAYEPYAGTEYPLPELAPLYSLNDVCDTYDATTGVETRQLGKDEDGSLYELESPVVTQHDPVAITVPAVTANIFADAGEVSVTYTKDTNKVIAALTEQISTLKGEARA